MVNNNAVNRKIMTDDIIKDMTHNSNANNMNNIDKTSFENYIDSNIENSKYDATAESVANKRKEEIKRKKCRLKAERSQMFSLRDEIDEDLGSGISASSGSSSSNNNKNDHNDDNNDNNNNDDKDDSNDVDMIYDNNDNKNNNNNNDINNNNNHNNHEYNVFEDEYLKRMSPRSNSNIGGNKVRNKVETTTSGLISGQGGRFVNMSKELLKALKGARGRGNDRGAMPSPQIRNNKKDNSVRNKIEGTDRDQDIVQTVDLSLVPLLVAPPIEDEKELISVVTFTQPADVYSYPSSIVESNGGQRSDRGSVDEDDLEGSEKKKKRYFEEICYNNLDNNIDNDDDDNINENISNNDNKRKYNIADVKSILKMEIEGSIEEVECTDIMYGPLRTKRKKKSNSEKTREKGGRGVGIGERDGGRGRGADRVHSSLIDEGQGQGQSEGEIERGSQLNYYTSDGQITTLTDLQHVEARDSSDLGGLRFSPRSVSISAVMTAADEMANDLTALKNDLGDLDDSNVRNLLDAGDNFYFHS